MLPSTLLFLICIATLSLAQLTIHPRPHSFYCSAGPLPEDPTRCFDLLDQVMREPWTHEELYFSESSQGDARLPWTQDMYGCQIGIFAYDENSGASFTLESYLVALREMVSVCFIEKKKIAWRRIWGVGSGIKIVIAGPGPWTGGLRGVIGVNAQLMRNPLNGTIESS